MNTPPIVSPEEWEAARRQLLVKEKELTRARDALAAERRRMPWLAVEKDVRVRRARTAGEPARPVRRPHAADRLPRLLRARACDGDGPYERAAVGCSMVADQVAHVGPPERARHHARVRLPRAAGRHPAPEERGWAGECPGTR